MNYVSLLGRLTKEPELKNTQSGKAYCKFTIAVAREFNREEADFINCVAWDKRAEIITQYFSKGNRILVQGRLQTGSYDDKNGQKVYTTDVIVDKLSFVESNNQQNTSNSNSFVGNNSEDIMEDDDFPF